METGVNRLFVDGSFISGEMKGVSYLSEQLPGCTCSHHGGSESC